MSRPLRPRPIRRSRVRRAFRRTPRRPVWRPLPSPLLNPQRRSARAARPSPQPSLRPRPLLTSSRRPLARAACRTRGPSPSRRARSCPRTASPLAAQRSDRIALAGWRDGPASVSRLRRCCILDRTKGRPPRRATRSCVRRATDDAIGCAAAVCSPSRSAPPRRSPRAHRTRSAGGQVFRAHSDLVVLHVNVFDGRSDAVPDLPQDAFSVVEDGKPQEITFFNSADVPVAVGLVVDNSGSMIARQQMVVAGGLAFADASHPEDELFVIVFNENVRFGLPPTVPFTHNKTNGPGRPVAVSARRQDGAARRGRRGPRPPRERDTPEARADRALGRRGQRQPAVAERHARQGVRAATRSSTPCRARPRADGR